MSGLGALRAGLMVLAVGLALAVQTGVGPHVSWRGVVPDLVLLVVVSAALARGPQFGMIVGFAAGVLVDLAPPADHVAGRWALALLVVGYVAGRLRQDAPPNVPTALLTVAGCSFLGSSIVVLTGLVLQDPVTSVADLLPVVLAGVVLDLLLAPFVVPLVTRGLAWLEPERVAVR